MTFYKQWFKKNYQSEARVSAIKFGIGILVKRKTFKIIYLYQIYPENVLLNLTKRSWDTMITPS